MDGITHRILFPLEPIVDEIFTVPKEFVEQLPEFHTGDWRVTKERIAEIVGAIGRAGEFKPGGCATSIAQILARLPFYTCQVFGSLGKRASDPLAEIYHTALNTLGIITDQLEESSSDTTGHCLCLVTPDGQRYMPICIGAAKESIADRLHAGLFENATHVHIEGFRFFSEGFVNKAIELAKGKNLTVSLDTGNEFLVRTFREQILDIIHSRNVDIFVGNEDEIKALTLLEEPEKMCEELGRYCSTVAVTLGASGCCIKDKENNIMRFSAKDTKVIDTTGAGDCFTAGLLHGVLQDYPIDRCNEFATLLASAVIGEMGNSIPSEAWEDYLNKAFGLASGKGSPPDGEGR